MLKDTIKSIQDRQSIIIDGKDKQIQEKEKQIKELGGIIKIFQAKNENKRILEEKKQRDVLIIEKLTRNDGQAREQTKLIQAFQQLQSHVDDQSKNELDSIYLTDLLAYGRSQHISKFYNGIVQSYISEESNEGLMSFQEFEVTIH